MAVPIGTKLGTQHADRSENGHQLKKILNETPRDCGGFDPWWVGRFGL